MVPKKKIIQKVDRISALRKVAAMILDAFPGERIFALTGELGAGKTTLIKVFCELLGVSDIVTSPTFAIINEYKAGNRERIFHFDFYRIDRLEEALDIGLEEYLSSGSYCFLEWPEKIMELLPAGFVRILISRGEGEEEREIEAFPE